jgi:GTPase SAR1 family protein
MSQGTLQPPALSRSALRLVLFGMPDAGKSSLLGALAEASDSQAQALKGHLVDPTQGLDKLRHILYDGTPTRTSAEVIPYPVVLEPYGGNGAQATRAPLDAVLFDCDGQVANEFLSRQRSLNGQVGESPLRDAILQADTLILAVDASNNADVLKRDFNQFARFLRLLEQSRSQRSDVGGLPVYLVLTKCDLLAKPGDNNITWMEHIEEHKRVVDRKFQEYLAQYAAQESHPFGKIDLHLWATAVKHPALESTPAKPRQPYGVAELFRQCLQSAGGYRAHQAKADRRLNWTVTALAGLVGLLVLLALVFFSSRPDAELAALETGIRSFRAGQAEPPVQRLKGPLDKSIAQLKRFKDDPAFARLSPELRDFVLGELDEQEAYQSLKDKTDALPELAKVKERTALEELVQQVKALWPPPKYAEPWAETPVGQHLAVLERNATVLDREATAALNYFHELSMLYRAVETHLKEQDALPRSKVKSLSNRAKALPYYPDNKAIIPDSRGLTYANVLKLAEIQEAYEAWQTHVPRLRKWELSLGNP